MLSAVRVSAELPGVVCFVWFGSTGPLCLSSWLHLATCRWLCALAHSAAGGRPGGNGILEYDSKLVWYQGSVLDVEI